MWGFVVLALVVVALAVLGLVALALVVVALAVLALVALWLAVLGLVVPVLELGLVALALGLARGLIPSGVHTLEKI